MANVNFQVKQNLVVLGTGASTIGGSLTITGGTLNSHTIPGGTGTIALLGNHLGQFAATTSAQLASVITDETGSGSLVFANSPILVTPNIGAATATSVNGLIVTPTTGGTLTIANGKTLSVGNSITLTGTDGSTFALPAVSGNLVTSAHQYFIGTTQNALNRSSGAQTLTGVSIDGTAALATAVAGGTAGVVLFQSAAGVTGFTAVGTAGQVLTSNGAGAPTWAAPAAATSVGVSSTNVNAALYPVLVTAAGTGVTLYADETVTPFSYNPETGAMSIEAITTVSNLVVGGNLTVNGTTTTINSTTLEVQDRNIVLANVGSPTNITADGSGITIKGTTDKTIVWDQTNTNFTSSEHWNLATGKVYKINNVEVLSATTLGANVVNSSLTGVGTITSGVWNGTVIGNAYIDSALTGKTYNGLTLTALATGFSVAGGVSSKTLTVGNTLTFTGTDASSVAFGAGGTVAYTGGTLAQFAATSSAQLAGVITDETGSGSLVFATSPTLVTPNIGAATGTSLALTGSLSAGSAIVTGNLQVSGQIVSAGGQSLEEVAVSTPSATVGSSIPLATVNGSTYASVEFMVQGIGASAANRTIVKIIAIHDGTTVNWVEYGLIEMGAQLANAFSVTRSGANVVLNVNQALANTVWKVKVSAIAG